LKTIHRLALVALSCAPGVHLAAQEAPGAVTLAQARARARQVSPALEAARQIVAAARGSERQAGAFTNPTLSYGYESAGQNGTLNSQSIAALEQPIELTGVRGARREAAGLAREATEARLLAAQAELDFQVTRAYAGAVAAERRAALAERAAGAFQRAQRQSAERLAAGDVSGYEARRIALEAARYAGVRAEAVLERGRARLILGELVAVLADSLVLAGLPGALPAVESVLSADSLAELALRARPEVVAAELEAAAAQAAARAARRERIPVPVASVGFKRERVAGGGGLDGLVAGVALPLPLWDRRSGASAAAVADARERDALLDAERRRAVREAADSYGALRAAETQLAALQPAVGAEAAAALRAAETAYAEGAITLVEWLDAVRAYQEAEASYAALQAEAIVRRAALERATGVALLP